MYILDNSLNPAAFFYGELQKTHAQFSFRDDYTQLMTSPIGICLGLITLIHLTAELNVGEAFSLNSNT